MGSRAVDDERALRFALWGGLQAHDGPDGVPPSLLKELGLYKGQRGIWVDKERTHDILDDGAGITVALVHTGTAYDDDLSDDGIIYRYPLTGMRSRDAGEIAATKNAAVQGVPVFIVAPSPVSQSLRRVRLGWVAEWDDRTGQFLVVFGEQPPTVSVDPEEEAPFSAFEAKQRRLSTTAQRTGQARFHFGVLLRYGPACALCRIDVREVLDSPHLVPVANRGSNDPRNGLVMCANHHRAFDAHLFGIEPGSLRICFTSSGPDARRLGVVTNDLTGLERRPHSEALTWRWDHWREKARA
jgi:putative restriction endonuclease